MHKLRNFYALLNLRRQKHKTAYMTLHEELDKYQLVSIAGPFHVPINVFHGGKFVPYEPSTPSGSQISAGLSISSARQLYE
jgi:hypothetical protein